MNDARSNFERRGGGARIGSFYPRFPSMRRGKRIRFIVKSDRFPAFMGRVASVLEKKKRKKKYRAPLIACVYVCVCVYVRILSPPFRSMEGERKWKIFVRVGKKWTSRTASNFIS